MVKVEANLPYSIYMDAIRIHRMSHSSTQVSFVDTRVGVSYGDTCMMGVNCMLCKNGVECNDSLPTVSFPEPPVGFILPPPPKHQSETIRIPDIGMPSEPSEEEIQRAEEGLKRVWRKEHAKHIKTTPPPRKRQEA